MDLNKGINKKTDLFINSPDILIRLGIGFVFIYASIAVFLQPEKFLHYFPQFLLLIIPQSILVNGYALGELMLALFLIFGVLQLYASITAALLLILITIFNPGSFDITFRNIAIIFSSLALAIITWNKNESF